jgi:hypothetical protein
MAISPDAIASVTLLDPMEMDGEYACLLTFKQPICVGLSEDKKPVMQNVVTVAGNIYEIATEAGLDPNEELTDPELY